MPKEILKKIIVVEGKNVEVEQKIVVGDQFVRLKAVDDEQGIIEAYVSFFGNVDSYGDVVEKGAFADAVKRFMVDSRYPKGVHAHNWDELIAKTLEMREDNLGLYIKGQLVMGVQRAREDYELMKAGVLTDFSFGYSVDEYRWDEKEGIRYLTKITIYEWSPVLVGANEKATLLNVKSIEKKKEKKTEDEDKKSEDKPKSEMEELRNDVKTLTIAVGELKTQLETSLKVAEPPKPEGEGEKAKVDDRGIEDTDPSLVKVILKDAQQAVKNGQEVIVKLKSIINK